MCLTCSWGCFVIQLCSNDLFILFKGNVTIDQVKEKDAQ